METSTTTTVKEVNVKPPGAMPNGKPLRRAPPAGTD
jgi:hypothetical protein